MVPEILLTTLKGKPQAEESEQFPKSLLRLVRQFRSKLMYFKEYLHEGDSRFSNNK